VPRIAFINKCDRVGADPDRCVEQIRERLKASPVVVQIPNGLEDEFTGIVDLIAFKLVEWEDDTMGAAMLVSEVPEALRARASRRAPR